MENTESCRWRTVVRPGTKTRLRRRRARRARGNGRRRMGRRRSVEAGRQRGAGSGDRQARAGRKRPRLAPHGALPRRRLLLLLRPWACDGRPAPGKRLVFRWRCPRYVAILSAYRMVGRAAPSSVQLLFLQQLRKRGTPAGRGRDDRHRQAVGVRCGPEFVAQAVCLRGGEVLKTAAEVPFIAVVAAAAGFWPWGMILGCRDGALHVGVAWALERYSLRYRAPAVG
jgi:hypothetical protein